MGDEKDEQSPPGLNVGEEARVGLVLVKGRSGGGGRMGSHPKPQAFAGETALVQEGVGG